MKRAAIYCRVSTVHHGQSVDMQLHDLRRLAEQRGFQIVQEYSDQGISGSQNSRPALDAMLADAKRGKFQILLTWRLDRLGRSTAHLIHLLEDLKHNGHFELKNGIFYQFCERAQRDLSQRPFSLAHIEQ